MNTNHVISIPDRTLAALRSYAEHRVGAKTLCQKTGHLTATERTALESSLQWWRAVSITAAINVRDIAARLGES